MSRTVFTYSVKVYPNVFSCVCKNTETGKLHVFEISERSNQSDELYEFFSNGKHPKAPLFCGYGNFGYDDIIIAYFLEWHKDRPLWSSFVYDIFKFSDKLIKYNEERPEGDNPFIRYVKEKCFYSMDLMRMLFSSKRRTGLKFVQVVMNHDDIQEFNNGLKDNVPGDMIDSLLECHISDVNSIEELLNKRKEDVAQRLFIQEKWRINCLSMNNAKIAEEYLAKKCMRTMRIDRKALDVMRSHADTVDLKDVILPFVKYDHPKLQAVLNDIKNQTVSTTEKNGYENKFCIMNTVYSVGMGGIHSINTPGIFKPADDEYIQHLDAASQYPTLLIEWNFAPRHLKGFRELFVDVRASRLDAKHSGDNMTNRFLKDVLNIPIGKMYNNTSWMYDPKNAIGIRLNSQLILLMLIDRLLKLNVKIIQANTDGIVFLAKKKYKEQIQEQVKEIESLTRLTFEGCEYKAFYQYSCNDYFCVLTDNSIEKRGIFVTHTDVDKGMAPLIVPKAVINYFTTVQPVEGYIRSCTDITDFLMSQRVSRKYSMIYEHDPVQRINRWYASMNGRKLYRVEGDTWSDVLAKTGVTILNKFDNKPISERRINYQYYIEEACKIIRDMTQVQLSLFPDEDL